MAKICGYLYDEYNNPLSDVVVAAVKVPVSQQILSSASFLGSALSGDGTRGGGDANWSAVELLLEFEGTLITDSSSDNRTVTTTGSPTITTDQYRVGAKSCYFNGSNSYFTVALPALTNYTFEWWMRPAARTGVYIRANGGGDYCNIGFGATYLYCLGLTTNVLNTAIPLDEWTHLAVQRSGSQGRMFINGELAYSNNAVGTSAYDCNMQLFGAHDSADANGYIDSVRITSAARYTDAGFTPNEYGYPQSSSSVDPWPEGYYEIDTSYNGKVLVFADREDALITPKIIRTTAV